MYKIVRRENKIRKRIYFIFILAIFSLTSTLIPNSSISSENQYYLPLVVNSIPDIRVVVTKRFNYGFASNNIISGYVINWSDEPYYSTTLVVDILIIPFCDPSDPFYDDCGPYVGRMILNPAFSTTLPGQINPFSHRNLCYKDCIKYYNVFVENATHDPPDEIRYIPLTLVRWDYKIENESYISFSGVIRNDTKETLHNLRLVVANMENCLTEAEIYHELLKPGQRTTFKTKILVQDCLNDNLVFIGQGESMP